MTDSNSMRPVEITDSRLSGPQKAIVGGAGIGAAILIGLGTKNFLEATNFTDAINHDTFRATLAGLAGLCLGGFALNESHTDKNNDDKGKYRAITGITAVGLGAAAIFMPGGGSSEARASNTADTTVVTSPPKTNTNGTIMSTNSTEASAGTEVGTEVAEVGVGGFPCEIIIPFRKNDGLGLAKIQGALDETGDPRYNAGPTDGIQLKGGQTSTALINYKSDHGYDPTKSISLKMCNEFLSLTDGNADTPAIPDYNLGS